jgi:serine phosphatase RsbU (regulator of sigma subunit)
LETDSELRQVIRDVAAGASAQRLPATAPVAGQRSHVTVLPLQSRDRTHGVLVTGRTQPLDPVAYMAALELARRAALAVDNARLHEEQLSTVNALQASLLPTALPTVRGVQLAARYHSASTGLSVGGDFYDAYTLPTGMFALAIGDVCGKGAEAATVTGMTRDLLRVLLQDGASPAAALHRLNRALIDHPTASRFCTVALATVARLDGQLRVRLCLAGHPEPVVLRGDGSTELVGTPGDLLGVMPDEEMSLAEVDVSLAPGESLVFYTDGVTERRDETKMFGQFGVRKALEAVGTVDAQAIADTLDEATRSFVSDELRDDVAILVVRNDSGGV